jgi:hypothetical protein
VGIAGVVVYMRLNMRNKMTVRMLSTGEYVYAEDMYVIRINYACIRNEKGRKHISAVVVQQ